MKKKLLITSILSIVMCLSLAFGATFALFTSESTVNVAVTSGKVKVVAQVQDTMKKTLYDTDWTAFTYSAVLNTEGTVTVGADGNVTLTKMLPGDAVKFNIKVFNESNVTVKYRTSLTITESNALLEALNVTVDGQEIANNASPWVSLSPVSNPNEAIMTYPVEISLDENTAQVVNGENIGGLSCAFNVKVEAIQGNAETVDNIVVGNTTVDENNETEGITNIGGADDAYTATAPAGTDLKEGATTMTLSVNETEDANTGNFEFAGATTKAFDIVIHEVAENNDKPIVITLEKVLETGLDAANVKMFHNDEEMTRVATPVNHNEFSYDPATGDVVIATKSFSTFTMVALPEDATVVVSSADALIAALEDQNGNEVVYKEIVLKNDIKIDPANMSNAYGTTGINITNNQTLNGAGCTIDVKGAGGTWDSGINITGGTIKNITITGSFRGIFINHNSTECGLVTLEDVTTTGTVYTISCDQGTNNGLVATNCKFYGWTSFAGTLGEAKFVGCTFGAGSGYNFSRPYAKTTYINCVFEEGHIMDPIAEIIFDNCKYNNTVITSENLETLDFVTDINKVTIGKVVSSGDELQDAINNGSGSIILGEDIDLGGGIVIN